MEQDWRGAAQRYCERLGKAEHEAWLQRKNPRKKDRFQPSQYLRDLCHLIGYGSEEEFKVRKMLEGHASALRH